MTRREFLDLLDRHGADPAHWPADRRAAAERALDGDAELRALLTAERVLTQTLASMPTAPAGAALRRAVLDIPLHNPRGASAPSIWQGLAATWRRWTAGMATVTAAGLLGFVLGYGQLVSLPTATAGEQVSEEDLVSLLSDVGDFDTADLEKAQ